MGKWELDKLTSLVVILAVLAGCAEYSNPYLDSLMAERRLLEEEEALLAAEKNKLKQADINLQQRQIQFMGKLSIPELTAYERLNSTPPDNLPKTVLNQRLLLDILSEDNTIAYWNLVEEEGEFAERMEVLNQKIQAHNERLARYNQNVQVGIELTRLRIQQFSQQNRQY